LTQRVARQTGVGGGFGTMYFQMQRKNRCEGTVKGEGDQPENFHGGFISGEIQETDFARHD